MVEPQDTRANALPLDGVTEKRGRGRPRKPGALTNAQRQAAFRARRKASGVTVTVTKKVASDVDAYDDLVLENDRLREELAQLRAELADRTRAWALLHQASRQPVGNKWSYRQLTVAAEERIRAFVEQAESTSDSGARSYVEGWARGVWFLWDRVTSGWQNAGDGARLESLFDEVTRNEK